MVFLPCVSGEDYRDAQGNGEGSSEGDQTEDAADVHSYFIG